jgi:hypothetical protein
MMTAELVQAARYFATLGESVLKRDCPDMPVRQLFPAVLDWLNTEIEASRTRHQSESGLRELKADELITAAQVAAKLGLSKRQVLRKVHDLEGEKVGNSYVFKRSVVIDYKEATGKP